MEHVERTISKHHHYLANLLQGSESLTLDEIREADNLNYHREWFCAIIKHAVTIQETLETDFLSEVKALYENQIKFGDILERNAHLEYQNE